MSSTQMVFEHVHIISKEPEKAAQWYVDVLGGEVLYKAEDLRGAPQIGVQFEGVKILVRGQRPGEEPGNKDSLQSFEDYVSHNQWGTDHFAFKIFGDLVEFCDGVKERGGDVSVEPHEFMPGSRIAFLSAPDGVSIELVEAKQK